MLRSLMLVAAFLGWLVVPAAAQAPLRSECLAMAGAPLFRKTQLFAKIAHRAIWAEPSLLAEIEHSAKSATGKLRHLFFKGFREDL